MVSKYKQPFAKQKLEAYQFPNLSAEFKYLPSAIGIQSCQLQQFTYLNISIHIQLCQPQCLILSGGSSYNKRPQKAAVVPTTRGHKKRR
jgi:hypothetical protein